LYVDNSNLIVADLGNNLNPEVSPKIQGSVYKIHIPDKSVKLINSSYRLGGLDGVVKVGDKLLVSAKCFFEVNNRKVKGLVSKRGNQP